MSHSLRYPQMVPSDHCYSIIQDHGPDEGGWGPAAIYGLPLHVDGTPVVYTGVDPMVVEALEGMAVELAEQTGKETRLVRYRGRDDLLIVEGR